MLGHFICLPWKILPNSTKDQLYARFSSYELFELLVPMKPWFSGIAMSTCGHTVAKSIPSLEKMTDIESIVH